MHPTSEAQECTEVASVQFSIPSVPDPDRYLGQTARSLFTGLMVYEPKFNAELLAALLAISPSKTLLRRHLSIHFAALVGR